jgi:signal transduction histidine kinase
MEETLRQRTYELGERVKELNCLFAISSLIEKPGISLEEILQGTVELIPPALRYPGSTCARITLDGRTFCSTNWRETDSKQTSYIVVNGARIGALEVDCLEKTPKNGTPSFLKEESGLIDAVSERLGKIIARDLVEKEKKHLEAQLRQFQKMETIGSLAGGIAHDFNNILTPIIGYSEITMDYVPKDSVVRNNLNEVLNAAMRAKNLVQQILTFSRQSDQELKPIKISPVVQEALSLLRASLPATIKISQNLEKECGSVLAEPTQIHQIVMNLCTNAYHSMSEKGGMLGVTLREVDLDSDDLVLNLSLNPGPHLILSVSDTGHGMDRGVTERIFDPYFTTKPPGRGTGIGLSVVHGIVKSYAGEITVYSEVGAGTIFNVYLPIIKTDAASETLSSQPSLKGNEHILLIDDEEPIVRMVQQMLEHLGYNVTALTNSMKALEAFRRQPEKFDLVITDQTMPNITGAQLAQKLLGIRPDIPIILCTGFSEVMMEEKARAIGIREYIMKPVIKSGLSKAIRKILD